MSNKISYKQAFEILENFKKNPGDVKTQAMVFNMARKFPLPVTALALQMYQELLFAVPNYTLFKAQQSMKAFENKDIAELLHQEDDDEPVVPKPKSKRGRKPKQQQQEAPDTNKRLEDLLSEI